MSAPQAAQPAAQGAPGPAPAAQPAAGQPGADGPGGPKFGRRALGPDGKPIGGGIDDGERRQVVRGWGEETEKKPMFEQPAQQDLAVIEAGADINQVATPVQLEDLSREVAAAPVEYHSAMPKLADLDSGTANRWSQLTLAVDQEFDITCLTSVLVNQLDETDEAWAPEVLLVQLTSELLDQQQAATTAKMQARQASQGGGPVTDMPDDDEPAFLEPASRRANQAAAAAGGPA